MFSSVLDKKSLVERFRARFDMKMSKQGGGESRGKTYSGVESGIDCHLVLAFCLLLFPFLDSH